MSVDTKFVWYLEHDDDDDDDNNDDDNDGDDDDDETRMVCCCCKRFTRSEHGHCAKGQGDPMKDDSLKLYFLCII